MFEVLRKTQLFGLTEGQLNAREVVVARKETLIEAADEALRQAHEHASDCLVDKPKTVRINEYWLYPSYNSFVSYRVVEAG